MTDTEKILSNNVENVVKEYEEKKKIDIENLFAIVNSLTLFEHRNGPISIDKKTRTKFDVLFQLELERYTRWLLTNRSKIGEKKFNFYINQIEVHSHVLIDDSLKKEVDKIILSNKQGNQLLQPPPNYKFLLITWTATIIFLSFLSFFTIYLITNKIKNNYKKK